MTTFSDINSFDWSSVVNDQALPPRSMVKMEQIQLQQQQQSQQQQQPISPVSDNDNNNVWFDGFLNQGENDPQLATTTTSSSSASPLEFSSIFDVENDIQPNEPQSLFSSAVTSLENSPMIKSEENGAEVPQLDLGQSSIARTDSNVTMNSDSSSTDSKKTKKKRAPRKRLTPHQKQAHNKIEKRYRININAKIAGLQQIIPWVSSEKTAFETGENGETAIMEDSTDVPRLNKSMILEKATAYILFLQEKEKKMQSEIQKLRDDVISLGGSVIEQ
jgi:twist-like factor